MDFQTGSKCYERPECIVFLMLLSYLFVIHNAGVAGSSPAVATSFFNDLAIILKKNHI